MLGQLASLSALAEETANAFPDLDDLDDLEGDESGEATLLRSGPSEPGKGPDEVQADEAATETVSSAPTRSPKATEGKGGGSRGGSGGKSAPQAEPEVDGDATVLISSNDVPAGTQHLSGSQRRTSGSN